MDKGLQYVLDQATKDLAKAKALIDEGEAIKAQVKEATLPLMEAYAVKSSTIAGVGTIARRTGRGSRIDVKTLTEELLREGMDAKLIPRIIALATKSWSYSFVEFRREAK